MNINVFKDKQIPLIEAQKLFRVYPYIPVEGDLVYSCRDVLCLCPNWDLVSSTKPYQIRQGNRICQSSLTDRTEHRYLLSHKILQLRKEYLEVITEMEKYEVTEEENIDETPTIYEPRFGEGLFSFHRSGSDTGVTDSLTESITQSVMRSGSECVIQKEGVTVSLKPKEQTLLHAFRVMRSFSLSLSFFVNSPLLSSL